MNTTHRLPERGVLELTRVAGDAARTRQTIWLLGVEHTPAAVRAHRFRSALFQACELLSAMPWAKEAYNLARDAAQDPNASGESLRRSLEGVMHLAGGGRARKVFNLARDELGATYSPVFGTARM